MGSPVNIIGSHSQNFLHNSAILYQQRGIPAAVVALDGTHKSVDRWYYRFEASSGSMTFRNRQNNGSPNNKTYYCITAESTAGSATGVIQNTIRQVMEKSHARKLLTMANGVFSLGFWYSSNVNGTHTAMCTFNTTTAFTASHSGTQVVTFNYTGSGAWQYVTATFNMPITGNGTDPETGAGLLVNIGPRNASQGITTWASGNNFQVTQMQLNPGPTPATWRMHGENETEELAICKRYYQVNPRIWVQCRQGLTTEYYVLWNFEVEMRVGPTPVLLTSTPYSEYTVTGTGRLGSGSTISVLHHQTSKAIGFYLTGFSGLTALGMGILDSASFAVDADL